MAQMKNIADIPPAQVLRIPTGIEDLDWIYGVTGTCWGLPVGKISLWAGQPGIGKSRAAIETARQLTTRRWVVNGQPTEYDVLYFQNEVDLSIFANWVRKDGRKMPKNFYVSDATKLSEQLNHIRQIVPSVVIVDSINMIEEFGTGCDGNIKEIINGYRQICNQVLCHVIFLSQLTKKGEARGSAILPHLVDIEMDVVYLASDGFSLQVGSKHRYGRTGDRFMSWWKHTDKKAECFSEFRKEDKLWCQVKKVPVRDIGAEIKKELESEKKGFFSKIFN